MLGTVSRTQEYSSPAPPESCSLGQFIAGRSSQLGSPGGTNIRWNFFTEVLFSVCLFQFNAHVACRIPFPVWLSAHVTLSLIKSTCWVQALHATYKSRKCTCHAQALHATYKFSLIQCTCWVLALHATCWHCMPRTCTWHVHSDQTKTWHVH